MATIPPASRLQLLLIGAAFATLAACGGGGGGSQTAGPLAPSPSPSPSPSPGAPAPGPSPSPAPSPVPAGTVTLYFSDCQSGAAPDCVAGSNSNLGTSASAPKRDLAGLDIGRLGAGSQLLFRRGGAWDVTRIDVHNSFATPDTPLVFDAYGTGAAPLLRANSGAAIQVGGGWGNTDNDGGYTFRNLRLQGGAADADNVGVWLVQNVRHVVLENMTISAFGLAIHASGGSPYGVTGLVVRNSVISRNSGMGHLGTINDSLFEGNLFEGNNFRGSPTDHAVYLSGGNNNTVRNNRFVRNSVVNGECTGGNVTAHGVIDGLLLEGNVIEQDRGSPGCFGFSVTAGYSTPESFRNVVVRGNTIVNTGTCAVCVNSAPGVIIENNRAINTTGRYHVLAWTYGENEVPMTDPVVRNNTLCATILAGGITNIANALLSGNVVRTAADAASGACTL